MSALPSLSTAAQNEVVGHEIDVRYPLESICLGLTHTRAALATPELAAAWTTLSVLLVVPELPDAVRPMVKLRAAPAFGGMATLAVMFAELQASGLAAPGIDGTETSRHDEACATVAVSTTVPPPAPID
jgi:hypothetical protein